MNDCADTPGITLNAGPFDIDAVPVIFCAANFKKHRLKNVKVNFRQNCDDAGQFNIHGRLRV